MTAQPPAPTPFPDLVETREQVQAMADDPAAYCARWLAHARRHSAILHRCFSWQEIEGFTDEQMYPIIAAHAIMAHEQTARRFADYMREHSPVVYVERP